MLYTAWLCCCSSSESDRRYTHEDGMLFNENSRTAKVCAFKSATFRNSLSYITRDFIDKLYKTAPLSMASPSGMLTSTLHSLSAAVHRIPEGSRLPASLPKHSLAKTAPLSEQMRMFAMWISEQESIISIHRTTHGKLYRCGSGN